jgi:hypothetical protein
MKNIQGALQIIKQPKRITKDTNGKAKNLQYKFFRTSIITTFIAILALY